MEEQIIKYTIDIDSRDKLIDSSAFYILPFNHEYIIKSLNPYEIKILFGRKQERTLICSDKSKQYYLLNPYINRDFRNVCYLKILNVIFPRYYNVVKKNINGKDELIKCDIYNQRFINVVIDINENTNIYSTTDKLNNCIKLKQLYSYNDNEKFIVLYPIHTENIYNFKYGQLKNIDRMEIKFYDDEYNQIILDFNHLINHKEKIKDYIKDHSVNIQIEVGCYEINMKNTNDY